MKIYRTKLETCFSPYGEPFLVGHTFLHQNTIRKLDYHWMMLNGVVMVFLLSSNYNEKKRVHWMFSVANHQIYCDVEPCW